VNNAWMRLHGAMAAAIVLLAVTPAKAGEVFPVAI